MSTYPNVSSPLIPSDALCTQGIFSDIKVTGTAFIPSLTNISSSSLFRFAIHNLLALFPTLYLLQTSLVNN